MSKLAPITRKIVLENAKAATTAKVQRCLVTVRDNVRRQTVLEQLIQDPDRVTLFTGVDMTREEADRFLPSLRAELVPHMYDIVDMTDFKFTLDRRVDGLLFVTIQARTRE